MFQVTSSYTYKVKIQIKVESFTININDKVNCDMRKKNN